MLVTSRLRDPRAWPRGAHIHPVDVLSDSDAARVLLDEAGGEDVAALLGDGSFRVLPDRGVRRHRSAPLSLRPFR